jgi:hypothetical protein
MLATADAHTLYEKFGFKEISSPEKLKKKHYSGKIFFK